ncbi:MAG: EamA family transporter [Bacteroidales bacterium]|jgi:undecaprenyl phosphate-alpha-L-ara4N flippase subunit ArnE|nr:EamA family transporter [Bacteroidales bacterium]
MWKLVPLAIIQSLFLCGGQVFLKLAMLASGPFSWTWKFFGRQLTNWWFLGCGVSFGVATVLWMYILKHYPFGIAYPLSCMSYAFGMIAAILIFKEQVVWTQWLGVFLVMSGCILIAK